MATSPLALSGASTQAAVWADRFSKATTFALVGYAVAAPHSIVGSQTMFHTAAFFWLLHCGVSRRWNLEKMPAIWPMIIFFVLCLISSFLSYEPGWSLNGMRSLIFMSSVLLVSSRIRSIGWAVVIALTLLASSQVNVVYTLLQRATGVGVRVTDFTPNSPLWRAQIVPGDVIQKAGGKRLDSLEQLVEMAKTGDPMAMIPLEVRRGEDIMTLEIRRGAINKDNDVRRKTGKGKREVDQAEESDGRVAFIGARQSPAHDFRATGFFNHYATYAEVLQLLMSLGAGIWISTLLPRSRSSVSAADNEPSLSNKRFRIGLTVVLLLTFGAMLCTLTRAPLVGFTASMMVMLAACWWNGRLSGRWAGALLALAIAGSIAGLIYANTLRGISVTDTHEGSAYWRLVVWQEGMHLVEKHPFFGVGKHSDLVHGKEWSIWGHGQLPPGHFHNTYLQIAVWWGLPALLVYCWMMWAYGSSLWRFNTLQTGVHGVTQSAIASGIVLGTLGGLAGFAVSSFVHFNFGDGEVIMTLWLMLGVSLAIVRLMPTGKPEEVKM